MSRVALVVDDSASMRQMVAYTLSSAGFTCHEAADGAQALHWLQGNSGPLHLIVTDLNMPVMDGLQLIREIRGRPDNRFTPILMLTTESQDAKKQEGRAAGATGWLVKPFDPDKLLGVVAKVVR